VTEANKPYLCLSGHKPQCTADKFLLLYRRLLLLIYVGGAKGAKFSISLSAIEDMETQLNASDEDQKQIFRHRKRCLLHMIFFPTK
jgi:hypothetical protein